MNKKIILSTVAVAVVATSIFAAVKKSNESYMGDKSGSSHFKKNKHHKGFNLKKLIGTLNLSEEQNDKVKAIVLKHKTNQKKISDAFSKTEFDKEMFIQITSQKRDNMIKSKANMIEEVYTVLTQEQKLQLKVLMDLKMNKMTSKRFDSDKHSYGRG